MTIQVQFFARARELVGTDCLQVHLPPDATVGDLRRQLALDCPALAPLLGGLLFAVNTDYATDATTLSPNATIACFPPVSGG